MYDRNEHCKDVYAHYGVAMYFAQCLERGLGTFLIAVGMRELTTIEELNALTDAHLRSTLGSLLRKLREGVEVAPEYERSLAHALKVRNWLAHRYFWDRAGHFMTREGCDHMIRELEQMRDLFMETSDEFSRLTLAYLRRLGLSEEALADAEETILGEARADLLDPDANVGD